MIPLNRLSEASGNQPGVVSELPHRNTGLSRGHHKIMQHHRCAVGPPAIQRCVDPLPSIQRGTILLDATIWQRTTSIHMTLATRWLRDNDQATTATGLNP
jgi:hypothetical protein